MNEKERETRQNAVYVWEIGLLRIMYENGIINSQEYKEIRSIADNQIPHKIYMS